MESVQYNAALAITGTIRENFPLGKIFIKNYVWNPYNNGDDIGNFDIFFKTNKKPISHVSNQ